MAREFHERPARELYRFAGGLIVRLRPSHHKRPRPPPYREFITPGEHPLRPRPNPPLVVALVNKGVGPPLGPKVGAEKAPPTRRS